MAQEVQSNANKLNIPRSQSKYSSQKEVVNVAKCQLFQWMEVQKVPSPHRSQMYTQTMKRQYPSLQFTDEMYSEWLSEVVAIYRSKYPDSKALDANDVDDENHTGSNGADSNKEPETTSDPEWLNMQNGVIGDLLLGKFEIDPLSLQDRCLGCLLGVMLVDALGAPYEGHPYESITERCNPKGIIHMVPGTHMGAREKGPRCGYYTDDTMTTLALALSIVEKQTLSAQHAAEHYALFWRKNPVYRGLPDSAQKILTDVESGMSITETGVQSFADGSFANGGAMRISPVGLVYRNANAQVLRDAVMDAVISSHSHLQSIDGALAIALSVQYALKCDPEKGLNAAELIQIVMKEMKTKEMKDAVQAVSDGLEGFRKCVQSEMSENAENVENGDEQELKQNENENDENDQMDNNNMITVYDVQYLEEQEWLTFQIKAIEAVPFVLYCVLRWYRDPEQCAINIVNLGGDNDTTGAMAGAILGAMYGTRWIPKRWYENVENTWRETEDDDEETVDDGNEKEIGTDAFGLDLVLFLAMELAKLDFKEHTKFEHEKKE